MRQHYVFILVTFCVLFVAAPARVAAATATFVAPSTMTPVDQTALSTAGDNAGFLIGLNQTLAIILDTPIGASSGGRVSVFTLAPLRGNARAQIRIGSYNGGSPIIATTRNVRAGNQGVIGNLFRRGCGVLGGCDYIEIITNRTRRGATGVEVDYIIVNGEIVEITSPAPEPSTWSLLIVGFTVVAFRLKQTRRKRLRRFMTEPAPASG